MLHMLALLLAIILVIDKDSFVAAQIVQYDYTVCPEVPTLHCKNGSTCTPGIASFGQHNHLDLQTHDTGYHCKCKPGFIGHDCQTVVDECGGNSGTSPSCYNGSKCQKNGTCNCDELNRSGSSTDAKYAGVMCENISTSFCASSLIGNHAPNHQFCTNHGICKSLVMDGEPHPGCNCKDGYTGDHCELTMDPFSRPLPTISSNNGGSTNSIGAIILFSALIVAITGAVVGGALLLIRKRRSTSDDNRVVLDHIQMNGREKAIGVEALEADGSGTLGSPSNGNGVSAIDEDGKRQFSIGSQDDAERSSSEPEIV